MFPDETDIKISLIHNDGGEMTSKPDGISIGLDGHNRLMLMPHSLSSNSHFELGNIMRRISVNKVELGPYIRPL